MQVGLGACGVHASMRCGVCSLQLRVDTHATEVKQSTRICTVHWQWVVWWRVGSEARRSTAAAASTALLCTQAMVQWESVVCMCVHAARWEFPPDTFLPVLAKLFVLPYALSCASPTHLLHRSPACALLLLQTG